MTGPFEKDVPDVSFVQGANFMRLSLLRVQRNCIFERIFHMVKICMNSTAENQARSTVTSATYNMNQISESSDRKSKDFCVAEHATQSDDRMSRWKILL